MQSVARILTANPVELQPGERAEAIPSTAPGNEPVQECRHCMDSGWRRVDLPGRPGMRQCECVAEKARKRALAKIPERFRDSSFESFKSRDSKQQRVLSLMRKDPGGSWYLAGAYGNGKTHLLYAHYRELVTAGQVRCQVRTTRELVEELRRAEFDEDFVSLVVALLPGVTRTTCSGTTSTS